MNEINKSYLNEFSFVDLFLFIRENKEFISKHGELASHQLNELFKIQEIKDMFFEINDYKTDKEQEQRISFRKKNLELLQRKEFGKEDNSNVSSLLPKLKLIPAKGNFAPPLKASSSASIAAAARKEETQLIKRVLKIINTTTNKVVFEKVIPIGKDIIPSNDIPVEIQKLAAGSEDADDKVTTLHFTPKGLRLFHEGEIIEIENNREVIGNLGSIKNWNVRIE